MIWSKPSGLNASSLSRFFQFTKSCTVWKNAKSTSSLPAAICCSMRSLSTLLKPPDTETWMPGNFAWNCLMRAS